MKFDLSEKKAVVTGGSSGIGKAIAETLKELYLAKRSNKAKRLRHSPQKVFLAFGQTLQLFQVGRIWGMISYLKL